MGVNGAPHSGSRLRRFTAVRQKVWASAISTCTTAVCLHSENENVVKRNTWIIMMHGCHDILQQTIEFFHTAICSRVIWRSTAMPDFVALKDFFGLRQNELTTVITNSFQGAAMK